MTRVALVEDNPDNRELMEVILSKCYEVRSYENGCEALVGIREIRPDVILLDISLPHMDGTEVAREIRADRDLRDIPIIALTAHAMAGDRERFLASGFTDYITKPILDDSILINTIKRLSPPREG
jgi:two-component system, cell cycle response regulator DivK